MKNIFSPVLVAVFAFFATGAMAANTNISILDIEKIAKDSKAVHYIQQQVSKQQDKYQKEITQKQKALESEQKKLEGQRSVLAKEAFEKKQKDFEAKVDDLKDFVEKRQVSLKKASEDSMAKVNDAMKDIITDIAKAKEISVILPASQVVFSDDSLDISSEVLEKLNKKITKVSVSFD